ncbi:MAG: nitrilase-related carbon-nitrogen hydrolase [Candidatus Zixiibacteriota bacterium]
MKIGFVQFAPALADLDATIHRLESLSPQFAGAELLVLPELCNSGYNFVSERQAAETAEQIADSRFIRFLTELSARHRMRIVSGLNERDGDKLYNTAVLIGPNGVIGKYRKLHLFLNEKDFFQPGDGGLPLFDVDGCKVGLLICFDWNFPEVWRALALKGADIICHPSNLVIPGRAQRAIPVHAMVNRVYVITANRIGSEGDLTYTGRSLVAAPSGDLLLEAPPDQTWVGSVDVDVSLARDKQITPRNHLFADRRPNQYRALCDE